MVQIAYFREYIAKRIYTVVFIIAVLFFAVCVFGKYRPAIIMSDSMYPLLQQGDFRLMERVEKDDFIEVDKIYTYKNPDQMGTITHRCIDTISKDGETVFIFKGDNNEKADEIPVRRSWIKYQLVE